MKYFLISLFLISCSAGRDKSNVEWVQNMMDQVSLKPQEYDPVMLKIMKLPALKSIATSDNAPVINHLNQAKKLKNPFKVSRSFLERGKKVYEIYCKICHGSKGDGKSNLASYMLVRPPSLLSLKVKKMKDGQIYYIIRKGQGLMGGYESQILTEKDRWSVLSYLRSLQRKGVSP